LVGLQLYEVKFLTQEPSKLNHCISCRVNDTRRRRLRVSPETRARISEDPANVVEVITEAPNQGSEVIDIPDPNPTQEGKPRCITQYFKLLHLYIFILICLYYALSLGVEMEP
jgi:hypothetical protein